MIASEAAEAEELLWEAIELVRPGDTFSAGQLSSWAQSANDALSRADLRLSGYTARQGLSERDDEVRRQINTQLLAVLDTAVAVAAIEKIGLHLYRVRKSPA